MATDIAKAYVQIIPSAEGIGGNIESIMNKEASSAGTSSGKAFSSSMGSALSKGLAVAGGAATVAASSLAALGTSMVSNAKETASYGDNIDKLSQKIGISAEAFQEWDYVFSQNGADISIMESGMKKLAGAVTDAAGGSKSAQEKFAALGLSVKDLQGLSQEDMFGKVIAALQQMPEGAERTAAASDLLGKSAMELGPLLNQTAEDTEALKQQARDLGMIMSNESVKDAAAFTDSMDNLSRAMKGAKNTIAANLLPGLTEITNGFANLVAGNEGATEQIQKGFENLGQSFTAAIPSITQGVTSIATAVAAVAPDIISSLGSSLLAALPQLAGAFNGIIPQMVQAVTSMLPQLVQVGLEIIAQLALGIAQALPELIPSIVEVVMQMIDTLIQNIPLFIDVALQLLLGLADGLIAAIPVLVGYIPQIITSLVDALVTGIPMLIEGAIKLVVGITQALPEIIQSLIDALPQIIQAIADALPVLVPALIEGSIQLTLALVAAMPEITAALIEAVPQIIEALIQAFVTLGPALVETFTQAFSMVVPAFQQLAVGAQDAWQRIKSAFAEVAPYFKQKFSEALNGIKSTWSSITAYFSEIWNNIKNIFADALSRFTEIGGNIVSGIKNGISGAWDNLVDWFDEKIGGLVDGVEEALGIESPSKVFANDVGRWIPAGIAMGIQQGMGVLDDQIKAMTDEALVGTVTATTESVNSVNYVPNVTAIQPQDDRALQLLAEYLPIIADNRNTTIEVKQNDRGMFEAVRAQNNTLVTATGYHALA